VGSGQSVGVDLWFSQPAVVLPPRVALGPGDRPPGRAGLPRLRQPRPCDSLTCALRPAHPFGA
jgi:hypothetical protein